MLPIFRRETKQDKFYKVTSQSSGVFRHGQGRVLKSDGHIFYSPNCTRDVPIPLRRTSESGPIRRHAHMSDISEFHNPLWWKEDLAYLPFLPLDPPFNSVPFEHLAGVPWVKPSRFGFMLDPLTSLRWVQMRHVLSQLSKFLCHEYGVPEMQEILFDPDASSCNHKNASEFRRRVHRIRDWFSQDFASISFSIAVALEMDSDDFSAPVCPRWIKFLVEHWHWNYDYLHHIQATLGIFTSDVQRAGVFLDLVEPHRHQFSVDFLVKYNVPVWYPWGSSEMKASDHNDSILRLTPPVHLLQETVTYIPISPSPLSPYSPAPMLSSVDPSTSDDDNEKKPWIAFFAKRDELRKKTIENEDDLNRLRRLNRERVPPTKKTTVYVWEISSQNGSWVRNRLTRNEHEAIFDMFGEKNSIYNSVLNEWDCGPFEQDDDDDEDEDDFFDRLWDGTLEDYGKDTEPPTLASMITAAPSGGYDFEPHSPLEILFYFYGFVPPLETAPQRPLPSVVTEAQKRDLSNIVGYDRIPDDFCTSVMGRTAILFLSQWSINPVSIPSADLLDLASGNHMPLAGTHRVKSIIKLRDGIFVFDYGKTSNVQWKIGVHNILDALFICRLKPEMSEQEIVLQLIYRGVQFHTFLPFRNFLMQEPSAVVTPWQSSQHQFSKMDYDIYVKNRGALLRNPRVARAAVQRGGIVWRLAMGSVGFGELISGPSTMVSLHHTGVGYEGMDVGVHLCDDMLHQTEEDVICGVIRSFNRKYY